MPQIGTDANCICSCVHLIPLHLLPHHQVRAKANHAEGVGAQIFHRSDIVAISRSGGQNQIFDSWLRSYKPEDADTVVKFEIGVVWDQLRRPTCRFMSNEEWWVIINDSKVQHAWARTLQAFTRWFPSELPRSESFIIMISQEPAGAVIDCRCTQISWNNIMDLWADALMNHRIFKYSRNEPLSSFRMTLCFSVLAHRWLR